MEQREKDIRRINELRQILTESNRRYYVDNAPTLSDFEYDNLMYELIELEKRYEYSYNKILQSYERFNHYPLRRWSCPWNEFSFNECCKDFSLKGLQSNRPSRRLLRTFLEERPH